MKGMKGNVVYDVNGQYIPLKNMENGLRTEKPQAVAASPQELDKGCVYRLIGTANLNFYLSNEASPAAADATDVLVPANTPVVIDSDNYDKLVFIGGGTLQILKLGV